MAASKMPPGYRPGISAGTELAGNKQGDPSKTGSGLDGHSPVNFGSVAPIRNRNAAPRPTRYALGRVPD